MSNRTVGKLDLVFFGEDKKDKGHIPCLIFLCLACVLIMVRSRSCCAKAFAQQLLDQLERGWIYMVVLIVTVTVKHK